MRKRHCKTKQCRAPAFKLLLLLISDTNNGQDMILLHKSFPFQWISSYQQDNIYIFACSIIPQIAKITSEQQLSKNLLGSYRMEKIFLAEREKSVGMNSNISHLVGKDGSRVVLSGQKLFPFSSAAQTILVPIKQRRENAENWTKKKIDKKYWLAQLERAGWNSPAPQGQKRNLNLYLEMTRAKEEGGYIYFGVHSSLLKYFEAKTQESLPARGSILLADDLVPL